MIVFNDPALDCTDDVIKVVVSRAREDQIMKILVPTCSGETAFRFLRAWPAEQLIIVRHVCGFDEPNVQEMPPEAEKKIISSGAKLVTAAHAFGGFGRAVRRKFHTMQSDEIVANALRIFGQGTKVACEIVCMAADAGFVRNDETVISCGGTGAGVDTALILTPANTHSFFEMRVHEVLCKRSVR